MRLPVFLLSLMLPVLTHGQQQERTLLERIDKPDLSKGVREQNVEFRGGKAFQSSGRTHVMEFRGTRTFGARPFNTRDFYGSKGFWAGDYKFSTNSKDTSRRFITPNADKKVETKTAATKQAGDSGKAFETKNYDTRVYPHRGSSQARFDKEGDAALTQGPNVGWQGDLKQLSIEDVRELLNKNK